MPPSNEVLEIQFDYIRQELSEMKVDLKITKEQTLKTNGRVTALETKVEDHDNYLLTIRDSEEDEHKIAVDRYRRIKDTAFKVVLGVIAAIAAANQVPDFIGKLIKIIWMKN